MRKVAGIILSLVLALGFSVPAFASVGPISPPSVDEVIAAGGSIVVEKTVDVPVIPPNPDIIFLADTTGSMGDALDNVQTNIGTIMTAVLTEQSTAEFGVAQYKDFTDDSAFAYNLDQAITADATAVTTAVGTWSASGGGDTPEAQLNALYQLATTTDVDFRDGSTRIIVWFGDSSGHDPSNGITETDAINALTGGANSPIIVIAIPVDSGAGDGLNSTGQATDITVATGGVLVGSTNPGDVSDAILEGLTNLSTDVWPEVEYGSGDDAYLSVTFDPEVRNDVLSGTSVTFTETISVSEDAPQCDPDNVLTATVTFYSNTYSEGTGDEIGTEEITITVPDTTPPTVASTPTVNPAGKKTPPAGSIDEPGPYGGMNEDGFYLLTAEDNCDESPDIYVFDMSVFDTWDGVVFGPFESGTVVKFTEDPTVAPEQKTMGGPSSAVDWHIILPSDAVVISVDDAENVSDIDIQYVPPFPK